MVQARKFNQESYSQMNLRKICFSIIFLSALVLGSILFFTSQNLTAKNASISTKPNYGGALVVGITGDVDSFNPLFSESSAAQEITHLMLLGLADLNDQSEFVPELASSWEHSKDYLELTYNLRKDAVWSDGVPITAEDVKFTYDLVMDSTVASPRQGITEYIKKVEVKNPHTVTFHFTKAYPDQIFDTAGEILPKHVLENADRSTLRSHKFGRNPISSGPFIFKKWVSQQYIELAPNENYFGGRPYLDRVIFKIVPDQTNLLLQLRTGEVDMMINTPPAEVNRLKSANPNVSIYPVSGRVYYYIGYNHQNPLFSEVKVRQALTMAINRQGIIDAFLYGFGKPCLGPLPPMLKWIATDNVEKFPYSFEKSKQILAEAGWQDSDGDGWLDKDGQKFEFSLKTNAGNQLRADVSVILQDQLRKVGIKVNIETIEWTTMMGQLRSKKFEAYMGGWNTSFNVDPTPIFHSSSDKMFNFVSYSNPRVDRLIETGREEMDRPKAAGIWKETQRLIYEDQPYTFLFWIDKIVAVNKKFQNVTPIALSALYNLEKWYQVATN